MLFPTPTIICLLIVSVLAKSLRSAYPETTSSSREPSRPNEILSNSISPLELRTLSDWQLTDLLIVSDIDGNLHGLERKTGAAIWSLPIDVPLVQILGNASNENHNTNLLWFVEPFEDGSLYYFSPEYGLNRLPTSIKNLVMESPFSLNGDDKIYTGTRKTSLYTLNKATGEVTKQFGLRSFSDACPVSSEYLELSSDSANASDQIMLGKTTYELSIHSKIDSSVVWNVTYSHWGPNNIDNDLMMQNRQSVDKLYFTPFHDKSLLALSQSLGAPAWMSKLPSLAVSVFDVFSHRSNQINVAIPHPAKLYNALQHMADGSDTTRHNLCLLNKTALGSQWFAMSYTNFPTLIKSAPTSPYQMALLQYEKGKLDRRTIEQMRNLKLVGEEAEFIVSGIHKYGSLSPNNFYQPGAKFEPHDSDCEEDGSLDLIKPSPWALDGRQPLSLMDGIFFPSPEQNVRADLSIVDTSKELQQRPRQEKQVLPVTFQNHGSQFHQILPQKVSMLRRIGEDLIVMCTLICFLMAFVKIAQKFRYLSPERSKVDGDKESKQLNVETMSLVSKIASLAQNRSTETVSIREAELPSTSEFRLATTSTQGSTKFLGSPKILSVSGGDTAAIDLYLKSVGASDGQDQESMSRKKRKRGSRGGKRGGKSKKSTHSDEDMPLSSAPSEIMDDATILDEENEVFTDEDAVSTISLVKTFAKPGTQMKKLQIDNNLIISNKVLGYGSHGTVVYQGTFENRPVAVKRMLFDFYDIANHEVRLLQESDDHPNVIRYFCSQSNLKEKFLYIALELCVCSLEDLIEKQSAQFENFRLGKLSRNELLYQLASGLSYLHSLKIVHRDLKPQNILLGETSKKQKQSESFGTRLLISDFGLCKKLDADQSSFGATMHHAASGTSGWRAPELLRPESYSDLSKVSLQSKDIGHASLAVSGSEQRLTKAIDIFSLGCVFFYILTDGYHPFGDRYLREANIIKGFSDLSILQKRCPGDYVEAMHLISLMISANPKLRPDTKAIMKHPYFWNTSKKLEFLLKVSDRFEIERRDPPSDLLLTLESVSHKVHQGDWLAKFDSEFTENLGKYRKYHKEKVMDLLRALRNKYHHFNDMPPKLQAQMSPLPSGFYAYFNRKFPHLLMEIYSVIEDNLQSEHMFHEFF